MVNESGFIVLNGITDAELVMILQVKEKHESSLDFTPQQMQPKATGNPVKKYYDNVKLDWKGQLGLKAIFQIVEGLLSEKKQAQSQ